MPEIIEVGTQLLRSSENLLDVDYDYTYPRDLDLKPGSDNHRNLLQRLMRMAWDSAAVMNTYHSRWNDIDEALAVYADLDTDEQDTVAQDKRRPTSFVIPLSAAILATDLSYDTEVFLDSDPVFPYAPVGPEDRYGSIMTELLIQRDVIINKVKIPLHTTFRNGHAYGFGVADCVWAQHEGKRTVWEPITEFDAETGQEEIVDYQRKRRKEMIFEGNALQAWDPYLTFPDPSIPLHEFQRGEYIGRLVPDNYTSLREQELTDDVGTEWFNVQYLNHIQGRSSLRTNDDARRSVYGTRNSRSDARNNSGGTGYNTPTSDGLDTRQVDVLYMYVKLIPAEWGLGRSEDVERWEFAVGGDEVIVKAQHMDYDHNQFPCAVNAPDYDGFSTVPNSHLSTVFPMQKMTDWLMSAMMKSQNTSINGRFFLDPSIWNINDLKENKDGQGWIVRKRRSAWGRDVKGWDAPNVPDPTVNNMAIAMQMMETAKNLSGASDQVMGILQKTSGRTSAGEAQGTRQLGLSRLGRPAKLSSWMFMQDVQMLFAFHQQQFMTKSRQQRISGKWSDVLRTEYGIEGEFAEVHPWDVAVNLDVIPADANMPASEFLDSWTTLLQSLGQNPMVQQELAQKLDPTRIWLHAARLGGARNVEDFIRKGGQVSVVPDEVAQQQAQAGNIAPVAGL